MKLAIALVGVALGLGAGLAVSASAEDQRFVTIGTGGVTGVYYPAGGAICRLVNKGRKDHGIRCSVESTEGSAANIEGIRDGLLVMGIAQSDVQVSALNGEKAFLESGPYPGLRALFSVHAELMQMVARVDSGIKSHHDLPGKRVNIGNEGSGQRATTELIMAHNGWTKDTFSLAMELRSAEQSKALCENQLDAISFTAGVPNASVKEATVLCDAVLLPLNGAWVDALIAGNTAYAKGVIPAGSYRGTDVDTPTFGPKAVVLTSDHTPDEVAYQVVKAVFENFADFRSLHPAFAQLTKKAMVSEGVVAPLHPGALRYYREAGLMP